MSYLEALTRAHDKQRSTQRATARNVKRALFEIDDDLDALADFDESEALDMRERAHCQIELL